MQTIEQVGLDWSLRPGISNKPPPSLRPVMAVEAASLETTLLSSETPDRAVVFKLTCPFDDLEDL